jgi:hypothetical protein
MIFKECSPLKKNKKTKKQKKNSVVHNLVICKTSLPNRGEVEEQEGILVSPLCGGQGVYFPP